MKGLFCFAMSVSLLFCSYAICSEDREERSAIEEIPMPADQDSIIDFIQHGKAIRGKRETFPYGEHLASEVSDEDYIEQYEYGSEYDYESGMEDYEIDYWDTEENYGEDNYYYDYEDMYEDNAEYSDYSDVEDKDYYPESDYEYYSDYFSDYSDWENDNYETEEYFTDTKLDYDYYENDNGDTEPWYRKRRAIKVQGTVCNAASERFLKGRLKTAKDTVKSHQKRFDIYQYHCKQTTTPIQTTTTTTTTTPQTDTITIPKTDTTTLPKTEPPKRPIGIRPVNGHEVKEASDLTGKVPHHKHHKQVSDLPVCEI